MIRVGIADDHKMFAEGLQDALNSLPDIRVVFAAADAAEMLSSLAQSPVDVALIDLEMPEGGGMEVLKKSKTPSLVVSMHVTKETIGTSKEAGARGVFSKAAPLADLAAAIRAVAAGNEIPSDEAQHADFLDPFRAPELDPGAASLTHRETELLALLASGVSSTEDLADRLYISQKTVKNHLASIFQKLSVADRTQAAIEAIRLGIAPRK